VSIKKILVYSHDTFGLGNIRRMLAVSKYLVRENPDLSILVLSGSPMLHAFRIPSRIDYIKLPCLTRTQQDGYAVKYLDLDYDDTIRLRANLILSTVLDFQPDLILVDKKPLGVANELSAALELLQRRVSRPKLILLLRDVLDAPEATIQVWSKNHYHEIIKTLYDFVLVVGSPELFDLRKEYQFPPASSEKVRFCGYLGHDHDISGREAFRRKLQLGDERLVLVTAGGGEDGYPLLACYLQGLIDLPHAPSFRSLLLCGPEMSQTHRKQIQELASHCAHVQIKAFTDEVPSYINASDLTVSMGGYNAICEILSLKKRAIIVPRTTPVQEQWIRVRRMAALGLLRSIHPEQLSPERLLNTVQEEIARTNVHTSGLYQVDLNGLAYISRFINTLLSKDAAPAPTAYLPQATL
jgi:predicted glycosyltransferase